MIYAIYGALGIGAFLVVLNGYLRGAKKTQIDVVLSLLLVGFVITAFLVADWKLGFLAIAIVFFSGIVTRPIAARLASRLFAVSTEGGSGYVGLPPRPLQKISQQLGQPIDPNKLMEEVLSDGDRRATAEDALASASARRPRWPSRTALKPSSAVSSGRAFRQRLRCSKASSKRRCPSTASIS